MWTILGTAIVVAILSATPLSPTLVVALAIANTPFVILPDDTPERSFTPRFSPMTDNGEPSNGHVVPRVAIAMAVVLFIFISFVLGLRWLIRWRRDAQQARQISTSRPTNVYRTGALQTYSQNMHYGKGARSTISGSDLESLGNSPLAGTIERPAEVHLGAGKTGNTLDTPLRAIL